MGIFWGLVLGWVLCCFWVVDWLVLPHRPGNIKSLHESKLREKWTLSWDYCSFHSPSFKKLKLNPWINPSSGRGGALFKVMRGGWLASAAVLYNGSSGEINTHRKSPIKINVINWRQNPIKTLIITMCHCCTVSNEHLQRCQIQTNEDVADNFLGQMSSRWRRGIFTQPCIPSRLLLELLERRHAAPLIHNTADWHAQQARCVVFCVVWR